MNSVNKTLYIPLYGKSYVSRKGTILSDKKAEEIWAAEGYELKGKSASKWLAYYMGMRSKVFDDWLKGKINRDKEAVIVQLGCGMDSRVLRINAKEQQWYDVDFPEVITERRRYYKETEYYHMIEADIRDEKWFHNISQKEHVIIVMEGVSMYLSSEELKAALENICAYFEQVELLMDCYTIFAVKASKYKNPINDVGVTNVYGMDDPKQVETANGLTYIKEHDMTPSKLIDELEGAEKVIFKKLYGGSISKKMYRLYEYKK